VSVDAASLRARRPALLARAAAAPGRLALAGLVAVGFLFRVWTAQEHTSPRLLPDEYIYSSLARSIAHGSLSIRGHSSHFPAILEPLLAAPLWLVGGDDVERIYRLTQGMHALVASLVAVPVWVLARRLGASGWTALACAAFPLALPGLFFASFVTADAVGLTFAVTAVAAGVVALEKPTWRSQLGFLALAVLATLARVQYVVLPAAFLVGALLVERGRIRTALSAFRLTVALVLLPAVAVLAAGPTRVLGYYSSVADLNVDAGALAHWAYTDAFLLAYAAGWVLVPVALLGLVGPFVRARSRTELALVSMTAPLAALLLVEATLYASNGSDRFQERYLLALLPLVPLLFLVGVRRLETQGWRLAAAGVSAALFLLAALVPLSGYTVLAGKQDSPTLQAVFQLEQWLGIGSGALALSMSAALLALVAAACALRPRRGVPVLLALSLGVLLATSLAERTYDAIHTGNAVRTYAGPNLVDDLHLGDVSVLETPFSNREQISTQLFWNKSLTRILKMRDASEVDAFGSTPVRIARDGRILADGHAVTGPLLVEEYASHARLDGAVLVDRTIDTSLWKPAGTPRLAVLTAGRDLDGWFGAYGDVTVWPKADGPRTGVLRLVFSLPTGTPTATLDLHGPGVERVVRVQADRRTVVEIPHTVRAPWRVQIRTRTPFIAPGGRLVSAGVSVPVFVEQR